MATVPSTSPASVRTALVTGGNRGLGFATSEKLLRKGYRVILTARDRADGEQAAASLKELVPGARVEARTLDLASLASVRAFAKAFLAEESALHLLLNNAGVIAFDKLSFTADGHELQFGTNHLGHFLLSTLLEDLLVRSAPARVVVVSSTMHMPGMGPGPGVDFRFDNLDGHAGYNPTVFYRNSKLANMWFTYALARRLEGKGVTVNALCPGFVPVTASVKQKGFQRLMFRYVLPLLPQARSVEQASTHISWVATAPELEGKTGGFYVDLKEMRSSEESYDVEKQQRLWSLSERLVSQQAAAAAA